MVSLTLKITDSLIFKSFLLNIGMKQKILTKDAIKISQHLCKFSQVNKSLSEMENTITDIIGDVNFSNISRGSKKTTNKSIFWALTRNLIKKL